MLKGERLSFDEESRALYDAVAPTLPESHFQAILDQLEKRFPGAGPLITRYEAFRSKFVIPREKHDAVFQAAIKGCRARTVAHVKLPETERFTLEYVTNKSWSGYNWYQGNFRSLIQMNTDLPIYIDRALDLACHEGYPGHHVYNALLEKHLVRDRGWVEFSVYPLFSPQSLIAEGTANYGIDVAFPGPERITFEKNGCFPAAGLDPSRAAEYYEVQTLVEKLAYAGNEAARRYMNGQIDRDGAAAWLERYALMTRERAAQRVRFFDQYRSYVINYNLGKDLVRQLRRIASGRGSEVRRGDGRSSRSCCRPPGCPRRSSRRRISRVADSSTRPEAGSSRGGGPPSLTLRRAWPKPWRRPGPASNKTMIAIEITSFGDPEVLRPVERPVPEPGTNEVLVRVHAAGVNRPDILQRLGHYPPPPGASDIPGLELSGTVERIGPVLEGETERWGPGDRVCALVAGGGYAEWAAVPSRQCLPVPPGIDMIHAAAIPETYFTVWTNLFQRAQLATGESVLVHGGPAGSARPPFSWRAPSELSSTRPPDRMRNAAHASGSERPPPSTTGRRISCRPSPI